MRGFIFILSFIAIMVPFAKQIASSDSEPVGAEASLLFIGIIEALIAYTANATSVSHFNRSPTKYSAAIGGGLTAIVFFSSLNLVHFGIGFTATVIISSTLLLAFAAGLPLLWRPSLTTQSRGPP